MPIRILFKNGIIVSKYLFELGRFCWFSPTNFVPVYTPPNKVRQRSLPHTFINMIPKPLYPFESQTLNK